MRYLSVQARTRDYVLSLPVYIGSITLRSKFLGLSSDSDVQEMLSQVTAVNYIGAVGNGRTVPVRLEAITTDDEYVELVGKFSAGCDRGVTSLAVEAICASLAADLELPIPEPFIIEVETDFISHIPDDTIRQILQNSCPLGFGSKHLPAGFFTWATKSDVHDRARDTALSIYVFDCLIQNIDRKPVNPNCLTNGSELGIFDHEIALNTSGVLFWEPPWERGGLDDFAHQDKHIFFSNLKSYSARYTELEKIEARWQDLPTERLRSYTTSIPGEWIQGSEVQEMLNYLLDLKSNLKESFGEIRRILS